VSHVADYECQSRQHGTHHAVGRSRLRFRFSLRVLSRPAHTVADPVHPVGPCVVFLLEQGRARVAVFEPCEGNVQRGARRVVGIIADAV